MGKCPTTGQFTKKMGGAKTPRLHVTMAWRTGSASQQAAANTALSPKSDGQ